MTTLIYDIGILVNVREVHNLLYGKDLALLPCIHKAFLIVEDGKIADYGSMEDIPFPVTDFKTRYSAEGRCILPSFCDSHTHLVFAGSREDEFVDKRKGLSYSEIAAKGGGILNSARKLQETSEEALYQQSYKRLQEIIRTGTGAVEIKSGYGLTVEDELKMLRVIRRLKESSPVPVKSTFLGAHTFPEKYKDNREGYIQLIIEEMLPRVSKEGLADYI